MSRALPLVLLVGCSFAPRPGGAPGGDGGRDGDDMIDGNIVVVGDGGIDSPTTTCYGAGLFHVCLAAPAQGALVFPTALTIDTASDARCVTVTQPGGVEVCMIAAGTIDVQQALVVRGVRPLVLLADQTIAIEQTIDVSSRRNAAPGAGADALCTAQNPLPEPDDSGAGGGAGGSFGANGGNGGIGDNNLGSPGNGDGKGGGASGPVTAVTVRGGCRGGLGGTGTTANSEGAGGHSGGALYVLAGGQITVTGSLLANGSGGGGGGDDGGGGGGGSGGLIGLEAPMISVASSVIANGGGGGGGGDDNVVGGTPGNPGADANATTTTPAVGGSGPPAIAGSGGAGGVGAIVAGAGGPHGAAGGGGGGSVGRIYVKGTLIGSGSYSPAASLN